jgi:polyisoprenoid-binding protein YceI
MKSTLLLAFFLFATVLVGCSSNSDDGKVTTKIDEVRYDSSGNVVGENSNSESGPEYVVVFIDKGVAQISSDNANIQFAIALADGETHVGGFQEFNGQIAVDSRTKAITSLALQITPGSLWADTSLLTNQLKSPKLFDVASYPAIKFDSTSAVPNADDPTQFLLTGNLTLREVTREISIEVNNTKINHLIEMTGECRIDLGQFGIEDGQTNLGSVLTLTINVGVRAKPVSSSNRPSGARGKKGGGKKGAGKKNGGQKDGGQKDGGKKDPGKSAGGVFERHDAMVAVS